MTLHDRYEERLAAWRQARSAMLSNRLTRSRKEAQMHEADVEQDDNVAEYFADRVAEMARRVATDEEKVAALAAEAEEIRIAMVTEELEAAIANYNETLRALESQLAALNDRIAEAAALSRRAEELAETLPASAARQHEATAQLIARTDALAEAARQMETALALPPHRPEG